jgi:NADH-quinone oxidoreductase subunit N
VIPDLQTTLLFLPELMLIVLATFIFVAGAFRPHATWWPIFAALSFLATLGVTLFELRMTVVDGSALATGPLVIDYFGQLLRPLALLVGFLFAVLMSRSSTAQLVSERMGILLLAIVGLMLVARANELVFLFLGLEMVSIPTYILLFLGRRDRSASEATAKYFFLSLLASALFLYGLSFLYGVGGTTLIQGIPQAPGLREKILALPSAGEAATAAEKIGLFLPVAMVLIVAGLGFKIAAVPFHFYAPDVYEGTSAANAGLLAVVPKIAGITALIRLVVPLFGGTPFAWQLAVILAIATMTFGNICALWQTSLRRLLAYSSIAHSGYLLIGVAVALAGVSPELRAGGVAATVFYLSVYGLASLGSFAALTYLGGEDRSVDRIDQLAGLNRTHPWVAGAFAICLFSLAGIPIFAGFWGKFALFTSALDVATTGPETIGAQWFLMLAIVGAINAAIAAAYYLRVVAAMYFQPAGQSLPAQGGIGSYASMFVATLLVVLVGLLPRAGLLSARTAGQATAVYTTATDPGKAAAAEKTGLTSPASSSVKISSTTANIPRD